MRQAKELDTRQAEKCKNCKLQTARCENIGIEMEKLESQVKSAAESFMQFPSGWRGGFVECF